MGKKLTTEQFKEKAGKKHPGLYSYPDEYINSRTKMKIWCNKCGDYFYQKPSNHIGGNKGKGQGCLICENNSRKLTADQFITKSKEKHGNLYKYNDVVYINYQTKIKIWCNECEDYFEQTPANHLRGRKGKGSGCPVCNDTTLSNSDVINRLTIEEDPIIVDGVVRCRCTYCKEYFTPTDNQLSHRIRSLSGNHEGECRLYCSDTCKQNCPIFGQILYYKDQDKHYTSREVQGPLREMVLERDQYTCQRCGVKGTNLFCHHFEGVEINPIESADMDICTTLCDACHVWVHDQPGCTYADFRRKPCKIMTKYLKFGIIGI